MAYRAPSQSVVLIACVAILLVWPLRAYETDQYSDRLQPIDDSLEVLDALVNRELRQVVQGWHYGYRPKRFQRELFWRLGGLHWVDKVERWAMRSDKIDRLPTKRHRSIYAGIPVRATRVAGLFGVGATVRIGGVLVGSDKFGHFLSQGRKYHRAYMDHGSEEKVVKRGKFNEVALFGRLTTGVYSNADLVANYEGYLFYRSLFEDGIVAGKPALVIWDGDQPIIQRPFTWADHVNDYWDEALNPSRYSPRLQKYIRRNLEALCPQYHQDPAAYTLENPTELAARYAHLGLKDNSQNRLDRVCGEKSPEDS